MSGELVPLGTGMVSVKDKDGNSFMVSKDDPRYLSGELISTSKGYICVKDKFNKYYTVSVDDPKYLSGELVPFFTDMKHKPETIEKMKSTHKKNKHQQGEKNSNYGKCWIHNDKKSISIKKDELDKFLQEGWIKGRKMKF